jgi:hypothetical protein
MGLSRLLKTAKSAKPVSELAGSPLFAERWLWVFILDIVG